jgi:acyl carrier protein
VWDAEQEILPHRRYPVAQIKRDLCGPPIFETFFNFTQFHPLRADGWKSAVEVIETPPVAVDIDFTLSVDAEVDPRSEAISITVQYDLTELTDRQVNEFVGNYERSFALIVDDPDGTIPPIPAPAHPDFSGHPGPQRPADTLGQPAPPDTASSRAGPVFAAARNPDEQIVAQVWAEVLGCDRIGIHDQFFDLGGHSLAATQIVARLRQAFGVEIQLCEVFGMATVASLTARIQQARRQNRESGQREG